MDGCALASGASRAWADTTDFPFSHRASGYGLVHAARADVPAMNPARRWHAPDVKNVVNRRFFEKYADWTRRQSRFQ